MNHRRATIRNIRIVLNGFGVYLNPTERGKKLLELVDRQGHLQERFASEFSTLSKYWYASQFMVWVTRNNDYLQKVLEVHSVPMTIPLLLEERAPVTTPVSPYLVKLLVLLEEKGALSNAEIRAVFQLKDRRRLREAYITSAMKEYLICYTIKDKPQSRLQKYRLTDKGKQFLKH